jgi:hypothetical protein
MKINYKMRNKITAKMKESIRNGKDPLYVAHKFAILNGIIKSRAS